MSGSFTLTGKLLHHDKVTPHVNVQVKLSAVTYPDSGDDVVYSEGATVVTDADGTFTQALLTETDLYYTATSTSTPPLFDPVTFLAPANGTTVDLASLVTTSPGAITPSLITQAQQAATNAAASATAAAASAASVAREQPNGTAGLDANGLPIRAIPLWRASTAFVSGQTVLAPDGSLIKSASARTSRASYDATEQGNWTPALDPTYTTLRAPASGDSTTTLNAFLGASTPLGVKRLVGAFTTSATLAVPANTYVDARAATINTTVSTTGKAVTLNAGATWVGGTINSPAAWDGANSGAITSAVMWVQGDNVTIEGVTLNNVPKAGIGVVDVGRTTIRGCHIIGNYPAGQWTGVETGHFGINADPGLNGSDLVVIGNTIESCVQGCFNANHGTGVGESMTVTGNDFIGCWNHGVYAYGSGYAVGSNSFHRCQIPIALSGSYHSVTGNTIYTGTTTGTDQRDITGISMRDSIGCTVVGNTIRGMGATAGNIISLQAVDGTVVSGNVVADNTVDVVGGTNTGISVGASATTCNDNDVHDNFVSVIGRAGLGCISVVPASTGLANRVHDNTVVILGASHGIYLSNCDGATVHNNQIRLDFDSGSAVTVGLVALATSTRCRVHDNELRNRTAKGVNVTMRGIYEVSGCTANRYKDNDWIPDNTNLAASVQYVIQSTGGALINDRGAGVPALAAAPGSIWRRTDGGASTTLYVKESATGTTTWRAV